MKKFKIFKTKNKIIRILWNISYNLFFRFSPRPFLLRLFVAKIYVYPKFKLNNKIPCLKSLSLYSSTIIY